MLYRVILREGFKVNHKRVERLYREEGLSLRRRRRRKRLSHLRVVRERPQAINHTWAADFVHDALFNGRRFRMLTVIDEWSRECLAVEVDASLTGERVARVLERLCAARRVPVVIESDNGPEFRGRVMDEWAYASGVRLQFIDRANRSRTPSSSRSTAACARSVSMSRSLSRSMTRGKDRTWRVQYNCERPHSSLGTWHLRSSRPATDN